jgi:hypothetical protein
MRALDKKDVKYKCYNTLEKLFISYNKRKNKI